MYLFSEDFGLSVFSQQVLKNTKVRYMYLFRPELFLSARSLLNHLANDQHLNVSHGRCGGMYSVHAQLRICGQGLHGP